MKCFFIINVLYIYTKVVKLFWKGANAGDYIERWYDR